MGLTLTGGSLLPPRRMTKDEKFRAIARKRLQIKDARAWVQDLKDMRAEGMELDRRDIFMATNYIVILQDDLKRLQQEQTDD